MANFKDGAALLRQFMKAHLLIPADMAGILHCSLQHFYQIQRGYANLTVDHLKSLSNQHIFNDTEIDQLKEAYGYTDRPYDPRTMALPTKHLPNEVVEEQDKERPEEYVPLPRPAYPDGCSLSVQTMLVIAVLILLIFILLSYIDAGIFQSFLPT
jgi:hypothetical protein